MFIFYRTFQYGEKEEEEEEETLQVSPVILLYKIVRYHTEKC
jgi:hypothetical protein